VKELFFQFRNIYKSAIKDIANNGYIQQEKASELHKEGDVKKSSANRVGVE